jgi:hypothetical protein
VSDRNFNILNGGTLVHRKNSAFSIIYNKLIIHNNVVITSYAVDDAKIFSKKKLNKKKNTGIIAIYLLFQSLRQLDKYCEL